MSQEWEQAMEQAGEEAARKGGGLRERLDAVSAVAQAGVEAGAVESYTREDTLVHVAFANGITYIYYPAQGIN